MCRHLQNYFAAGSSMVSETTLSYYNTEGDTDKVSQLRASKYNLTIICGVLGALLALCLVMLIVLLVKQRRLKWVQLMLSGLQNCFLVRYCFPLSFQTGKTVTSTVPNLHNIMDWIPLDAISRLLLIREGWTPPALSDLVYEWMIAGILWSGVPLRSERTTQITQR